MKSPNQAHGNRSRPSPVTMTAGVKTNVAMTEKYDCTPKQGQKLQPVIYPVKAALSGNGAN